MSRAEFGRHSLALVKQMEAAGDWPGLISLIERSVSLPLRRAAARSLANGAGVEYTPALAARLDGEPDRGVRLALIEALGRLGDDRGLPVLLKALADPEPGLREAAARALARFNSPAAFEALLAALEQKEPHHWPVRRQAAEALGRLGDRRAIPALTAALRDPQPLVPAAAALALGRLGDSSVVASLKRSRHATPHRPGAECDFCAAIDLALHQLQDPLA